LQEYIVSPPQRGVHVIQPTVSVHSSLTVDPGLISISMAYGYMRAAETLAFGRRNPLASISDAIIMARLACWSQENTTFNRERFNFMVENSNNYVPPFQYSTGLSPNDDPAQFALLRNMKLTVRTLVCKYMSSRFFQPSFLPSADFRTVEEINALQSLGSPLNATDFRAWFMQLERHQYSVPVSTPWAEFQTEDGTVDAASDNTVSELLTACTPFPPFTGFQEVV
jgi:hypothetical protein